MKTVSIYVLLDSNGLRRYIGKSIDPASRIKDHRRRKFQWAVSYEILETCPDTDWESREKFWIASGRVDGWPLKNVADGGNAVPSWYQPTAETRAKMSAAQRARTPEYREKIAASKRGKPRSPETRAKISVATKGYRHTFEARLKMSIAGRGRPSTRKGTSLSPEHRAKLNGRIPWNKGKRLTDEHRANLSVAHVGNTHKPETCAKMSATRRGKPLSSEHRAAMIAAWKIRKTSIACA